MYFAVTGGEVRVVQDPHPPKVGTQWFHERGGKHRDPVLFTFSVADQDLLVGKINVLDT